MASKYLEFCKQVLSKVYFDEYLFKKEYRKALSWLEPKEQKLLSEWVKRELIPAKKRA